MGMSYSIQQNFDHHFSIRSEKKNKICPIQNDAFTLQERSIIKQCIFKVVNISKCLFLEGPFLYSPQ